MAEQHLIYQLNGKSIHYRDEGRDHTKTIVLLHGLLQNLSVWDEVTLKMMNEFRIISIDLPGHGHSDLYGNVLMMDFVSDAIKEVLNIRGINDCVIVGHSLGGYAALAFAENNPAMVRGIGLVHSHAMADTPEQQQKRDNVCSLVRTNAASYVLDFVPTLFSSNSHKFMSQRIRDITDLCLETPAEAIIAAQQGMKCRSSRLKFLMNTSKPVMFVYGKQDPRISLETAVTQAAMPHHSEMLMLDDVAHMAHIENPTYFTRWLANFTNTCYMYEMGG